MKFKTAIQAALTTVLAVSAFGAEGPEPKGIPNLDHVFFIMMENHGYSQIFGNPNAPFINQLAHSASFSSNYFAIGHPSLTNYLEVVGGSNFGVRSDDYPNWHSNSCTANIVSGTTTLDNPAAVPPLICPIAGTGTDAATPAIDCTNVMSKPSAAIMPCPAQKSFWTSMTMSAVCPGCSFFSSESSILPRAASVAVS